MREPIFLSSWFLPTCHSFSISMNETSVSTRYFKEKFLCSRDAYLWKILKCLIVEELFCLQLRKFYSFFAAIILSWENLLLEISLVCYPPVIIGILIFCVILGTGPVISSDFKCTFFCQLILDHLAIIGRCLGFGPCMSKMRELQDPHSPLFFPHDCADYERGCLHGFSSAFSAVSCCNFKVSLLVWARISQLYQCT